MKKSNLIVLGILLVASLFLLWLWWYLGFSRVDTPADVLISVAWWIIISAVAFGIFRMEERRREQMRTVYVSPTALFNCESGIVECRNVSQRVELAEEIMKNMKYGMDFQDMPDPSEFAYTYIIRTHDYQNAEHWHGTVVKVDRSGKGTSEEKTFSTRTSLATALI